jgi:SET domain-containing protein
MPDKQSGICYLYSVKKTDDKGLGVFAREAIKKGSVVWRHIPGLYVVYDEHSFKAMIEKMSHAEVVYELTHCFGLADFPGCMIRLLDDGALINHSSNANLVTNNSAPANASLNVNSRDYLDKVTKALLDDRYALVATRDIEIGEEYTNNYSADCSEPPYYDILFEQYGVCEDYLDDR